MVWVAKGRTDEPLQTSSVRHERASQASPVSASIMRMTRLKSADGSSVLLRRDDGSYVFVGWDVFSFKTKEPVLTFYSLIGNNDVPYPVAVTSKSVAFMLERRIVPKHVLGLTGAPEWQLMDAYT
eukprot:2055600-Pleurochrysis_carterae.AAC.1